MSASVELLEAYRGPRSEQGTMGTVGNLSVLDPLSAFGETIDDVLIDTQSTTAESSTEGSSELYG